MSIRDGDRLPRRRILTGSDLMKCGDRMFQKGYNGFIKVGIWRRFLFMKKGINKSYFILHQFCFSQPQLQTLRVEMKILWLQYGYVLVLRFFAWVRLIRKRKTIQMINNFLLVLLENRDSQSPFVICNCWLTDLQPKMVECKQQNCYIQLIKSAKGGKNDFS